MANHKWQENLCVYCGISRKETQNKDYPDSLLYEYSCDYGNTWSKERPDCHRDIENKNIIKAPVFPKKSYSELLKSPKWQRKRLEIMQRDNWKCMSCEDEDNELHVHHLNYTAACPWDEPNENLITLCNLCHDAIHYILKNKEIGFETFLLVMKLMNKIEMEDIDRFFKKQVDG